MSLNFNQQGAGMLLIVVIIGIVSIAALGAVIQSGLSSMSSNEQARDGQIARARLQACVDETIGQFRHDADFNGGSIIVGTESCAASISSSEDLRTITLTATERNATKTAQFTVDVASFTITTYEEQ